ncbi:unnamed protein product [Hapterophycus canaliculatus]
MSHQQKAFIARLSLYWVSVSSAARPPERTVATWRPLNKERAHDRAKDEAISRHLCGEVFLRFRPVISSLTRAVGSSSETMAWAALRGDGRSASGGSGGGATTAMPQTVENFRGEESSTPSRVLVRDEGGVLRVEVAGVGLDGGGSRRQREQRRLEKTFGKEAWQQTGLGELLWLDCSSRQYLAHRLAQQVAFTTAAEGDSRREHQNQSNTNDHPADLLIVSDLPLPYWRGTVVIARLGSHAEGVFVKISDAGRRLLIEAEDFEGGPQLASSTVSLEGWKAATGMATLSPPTDGHSFKKILEDQLAVLLSAGFRSRTSRLEKKRLAREIRQEEMAGRRWRGTFLHLSEMEKGEIGKVGEDSGGETEDDGTPLSVKKAQSSLPRMSPRDLTPLEQKRALRLEMLTRMTEEFHAKHGRRHRGDVEKGQNKDVRIRIPAAFVCATGASTLSARGSTPMFSCQEHPAAPARDVSGNSMDEGEHGSLTTTVLNQVTLLCVCCGGEGGRGHGRHCEHIFRRCGFCRVQEVKRVLGVRGLDARERGDRRESVTDVRVPTLLLAKDRGSGGGGSDVREEEEGEEEEFEWVTDSEEEDPEFQCDSCGRVIGATADRFHCETCGDHDLCQACFLSSGKAANGHQSVQEVGGGGHLTSHDVSRIMGKPVVLGR